MNNEITMNVSLMARSKESKGIYVEFKDGNKHCEIVVPGVKIINNSGFTPDELKTLADYVKNDIDHIYEIAKSIDPVKNFLNLK